MQLTERSPNIELLMQAKTPNSTVETETRIVFEL
jgi:hypothetical protein